MTSLRFAFGYLAFLALLGCSNEEPAKRPPPSETTFRVVRKIAHDPQAYTQGLLYRKDSFYESTGQYGASSLRRLNAETGQILQQKDLDQRYFGEGLEFFKGVLIQLTWRAGLAFVYDSDTFELLRSHRYETEGWGLTSDGSHLITSDGSDSLYFRDPNSFDIAKTLKVTENGRPVKLLNELEYIHGEIWANVFQTFDIVQISPETGKVRRRLDFSGILEPEDRHGREDVFNGIAYDSKNNRLFLTGKYYRYIYEVDISE